jgi:hypothetical protein
MERDRSPFLFGFSQRRVFPAGQRGNTKRPIVGSAKKIWAAALAKVNFVS